MKYYSYNLALVSVVLAPLEALKFEVTDLLGSGSGLTGCEMQRIDTGRKSW